MTPVKPFVWVPVLENAVLASACRIRGMDVRCGPDVRSNEQLDSWVERAAESIRRADCIALAARKYPQNSRGVSLAALAVRLMVLDVGTVWVCGALPEDRSALEDLLGEPWFATDRLVMYASCRPADWWRISPAEQDSWVESIHRSAVEINHPQGRDVWVEQVTAGAVAVLLKWYEHQTDWLLDVAGNEPPSSLMHE